ncbi:MAG: DUF1911 domain-containing protein [Acetatifactor sp.]|nr:DUF1911 domain-containing protein [Acetatifactor sp.]
MERPGSEMGSGVLKLRDKRKSRDYFEAYIACERRRLEAGIERLRACQDEEKASRIWGSIFLNRMNLLMASFSCGTDQTRLEAMHEKACEAALKSSRLTYGDALALSSFGIILDNTWAVKPVLEKYEAVFAADRLLNGFRAYILERKAVWEGDYSFPEVYGGLDKVLSAGTKDAGEEALLSWLETWYDNCEDCAWHGTLESKNDVYYGYWCLEAAALADIMGMNRNILAQNEFFPVL